MASPPLPLAGVHILLVDDHDDGREMLAHLLQYSGALVTSAATAEAALQVASTADIVVTDIRMPDHDGLWLLEQVRQRLGHMPVIALSAYSDLDLWQLQQSGFDRVLRKPVDPHQLVEAVTTLSRHR